MTHQKAGSQWVYDVLAELAPGRCVTPLPGVAHVLEQPMVRGRVYPTVYLTHQEFERISPPEPWRALFVLRDLRDTLVSWFFSFRHSHAGLDDPRTHRSLARLRARSRDDGLLYTLRAVLPRIADLQISWIESGVPVVRYEELVADAPAAFRRVAEHCGLEPTEKQLRQIVRQHSFMARSGRTPGDEDVTSHYRKGVVGDWRNHLRGELLAEFKERYDDVLVATGYERDRAWGGQGGTLAKAPRASATAEPPKFWARPQAPWRLLLEPTDLAVAGNFEERQREDLVSDGTLDRVAAVARWCAPGGRVLDVGSGTAALVALLCRLGYDAHGLEPSGVAAAGARRAFEIRVHDGALEETDPAQEPWDAVLLLGVVSRLRDPAAALERCAALLRPGGIVILDGPLAADLPLPSEPVTRPFVPTPEELQRTLARCGLAWFERTDERMFVAAREQPRERGEDLADLASTSPDARLVRALFDLREQRALAERRLARERTGNTDPALGSSGPDTGPLLQDRIELGRGWHALETHGGETFRWAGDDAEIFIRNPSGRQRALELELEPGPGLSPPGFDLGLTTAGGRTEDRARVSGRERISLRIPASDTDAPFLLRVAGSEAGPGAPGDSRTLNYRIFGIGWA